MCNKILILTYDLLPLIITFVGASFNNRMQSQEMATVEICVPMRIKARWTELHKLPPQGQYKYTITPILQRANVSAEEFIRCWRHLQLRLSNDELFSLFTDSGFSPNRRNGRSAFVRNVLKRYKSVKVFFNLDQHVFLVCVAVV